MQHWSGQVGEFHLLWVASGEKRFTPELFECFEALEGKYRVACWRGLTSASSPAVLARKGSWFGLDGRVEPSAFVFNGQVESSSSRPARTLSATFGTGTLVPPISSIAAELFEYHRNGAAWAFGLLVSELGSASNVDSVLLEAWLNSGSGSGDLEGVSETAARVLGELGNRDFLVFPTSDSEMNRGVVCLGLNPEFADFAAPLLESSDPIGSERWWPNFGLSGL